MYSEITKNKRKSVFMIGVFIIFVGGMGTLFGEYLGRPSTIPYILGISLVYAAGSYFIGSRMALALNGAKEIHKSDNVRLWRIIENLSIADGLPMPKVYIIDDPAPNAFATGRDPAHAAVCATQGLLAMMTDTELEGVFAHELGHVKNYDIRVSMVIFALVAVVGIIADIMLRLSWFGDGDSNDSEGGQIFFIVGIVGAILAPLIATLIQLAVSRRREYLADATGALTTRYPEGLISALSKIQQVGSGLQKQNPSTAHLFFANPLKGKGVLNFFSTHPPIEDRIARLQKMETNS
ncbi:MAG: zinc metalloprotease HtpX [Candidatus Saccharimonadales bacterium]